MKHSLHGSRGISLFLLLFAYSSLLHLLLLSSLASEAFADTSKQKHVGNDVWIENQRLFVAGKEFFVKGVSYNPAPLGYKTMDKTKKNWGYGGGGYCSAKTTVFGEEKSACYGNDFFDGNLANPQRQPPGPSGPWWGAIWARDFPIIKQLGANTVRIYNLDPFSKMFLEENPDMFPMAMHKELGAVHRPFLDAAQEHGLKVILPMAQDPNLLKNNNITVVEEIIKSQIDELGDHDALLMYFVGNELPLDSDTSTRKLINKLMKFARDYQYQRWGRTIPVSTALIDRPSALERMLQTLDVDFITVNIFRGVNLDSFFVSSIPGRRGYADLVNQYKKPVLFGEWGMPYAQTVNPVQPDWANQIYGKIVLNAKNGAIGGVFFEYCDEPYAVKPMMQDKAEQTQMGLVKFQVAKGPDNSTSLDPNVFLPDNVVIKNVPYRSLQKGVGGSPFAQYNYQANEYTLMGRAQETSKNYSPEKNVPPPPPKPSQSAPSPNDGAGSGSHSAPNSAAGSISISATRLLAAACSAAALVLTLFA